MDAINLRVSDCHFIGASNEMRAASYYLKQSVQVYFPVCQQSAVDFIIERDNKLLKVQVKTATWSKSGKYKYLQCRTRLTNEHQNIKPSELYDILFVVGENWMWEIPSHLVTSSNISLLNTGRNKVQWMEYLVDRD